MFVSYVNWRFDSAYQALEFQASLQLPPPPTPHQLRTFSSSRWAASIKQAGQEIYILSAAHHCVCVWKQRALSQASSSF